MNKKSQLIIGCMLFGFGANASNQLPKYLLRAKAPITEVPFTNVHLNDVFWSPRIEINRTVSIPSAFRECENNGRFDNFAIAAGLKKGEHRGDFSFDDTDPYKVIEGASYSLAVHYDKKLDHYLDSVISIIAAAQESDGYLTTCVTNKCYRLSGWWGTHKWEKINSHELYNSGHMIESAIAHYKATGKRTFLNVAIKNANLICETFGPKEGQIHRPSGHPIVEMALCKLYKVTGTRQYLDMAKYFVEETGRGTDGHALSEYSQDHKPILQQDEIVGHAVRAGYLFSGVADVASLTNDTAYFHALERIWENMAGKKLYITGGIGSRAEGEGFGPNYELNNMTAYSETCASIANVYWNYRMFLATGDSKYVDIYERALYNGVLSGVSLSGDKFFYDNPLESMGQHQRQAWFGCACCPGNVTRFIASVPQYQYASQGSDIFVNLYIQGKGNVNGTEMLQQTDYPWNGNIKITVNPKNNAKFNIRLRIPSWAKSKPVATNLYSFADSAKQYTLKVNGKEIKAYITDGYAVVNKKWKKGDVIELSLPMNVRRVKANDNVEDDRGKYALERGPIVYCLEGKDQKDSTVFNKVITANTEIDANYDSVKLNGIVELSGKAEEVEQDGTVENTTFHAIPYSTWNNRGADQMEVWIPYSPTNAHVKPQPTIASKAKTLFYQSAIQKDAPETAAIMGEAWGVNDQWEPKRSSDISKPYHYWWLKSGTPESVAYEFDKPYKVSNVEVYWLDFDHYDGNFRTPESWKLYYQDTEGNWKEVEHPSSYGIDKDKYNSVDFTPVTTTGLKIVAQLRKGASGGIIEWKVNN
jgi:Uncharacterized protein conserved in bacteria